jgi:hypothetical protein
MEKLFLFLLLVISVHVECQKIGNNISFREGQKLEIITVVNSTRTQPVMGEIVSKDSSVEIITVTGRYGTGFTLEKALKKKKLEFSVMGTNYTIDSDSKHDMEGDLGESIRELMKRKCQFTVDGSGRVIAVKTGQQTAGTKKKKSKDEDSETDITLDIYSAANMPTVGEPSLFKFLPEGCEVKKGDTWTVNTGTPSNQSKTTFTLQKVSKKEMLLSFVDEKISTSSEKGEVMTTSIEKTSGTVRIDRATGLLKQKTALSNTEMPGNTNGNKVIVKTKTLISVRDLKQAKGAY